MVSWRKPAPKIVEVEREVWETPINKISTIINQKEKDENVEKQELSLVPRDQSKGYLRRDYFFIKQCAQKEDSRSYPTDKQRSMMKKETA